MNDREKQIEKAAKEMFPSDFRHGRDENYSPRFGFIEGARWAFSQSDEELKLVHSSLLHANEKWINLEDEIERLKKKLKVAREALEFYASP